MEIENNKKESEQIKYLLRILASPKRKIEVNVDEAWKQVRSQTIGSQKRFRLKPALRYAAMIAVIFSIGLSFYTLNTPTEQMAEVDMAAFKQPTLLFSNGEKKVLDEQSFAIQQKDILIKNDVDNKLSYQIGKTTENPDTHIQKNHLVIPKGKSYQVILSDGTRIWLNSETELIYPTSFTGDKREVTLIGEAYFEVAKNKERPFLVNANGMTVRVLGTSFNVACYKTDNFISTTLVEGSVAVETDRGNTKTISPSEQFRYDKKQHKATVQTVNTDLFTSWVNGEYIFKDTPLEEIVSQLRHWYDFSVSYQDEKLKQKRFSLTVGRTTSIDQLLEIISYTSEVKLERIGNNIYIKNMGGNNDLKR
ncbi:MAG: DUF4974 domain-containing protein [Tannerellaceae bacterium]